MLDRIRLHNFKCFKDKTIPLGGLTFLSGVNSVGKSTIIQSFLLLRQSYQQQNFDAKNFMINGPLSSLGTAQDILHRGADEKCIEIELIESGNKHLWNMKYEEPFSDEMLISKKPVLDDRFVLFNDDFKYITAERIGPRHVYERSTYQVREKKQMGTDGKYSVAFLLEYSGMKVAPALHHPSAINDELRHELSAWLGEISPSVLLKLNSMEQRNMIFLEMAFAPSGVTPEFFAPPNVGFGIAYILPVLIGLLSAKPGSLVIIENPEAHLHPKGQVALGKLLSSVAASGVQVIVESHSDHLLNGIRIAVKQRIVDASLVTVNFFSKMSEKGIIVHSVDTPKIDIDGRLDRWPADFFDQWELSLDKLLG